MGKAGLAKEIKAKDINKAIRASKVARDKKAKAEILADGRIEYSIEAITRLGRRYRQRVRFYDILSLLHGEDMRELNRKYGR